MSSQLTLDSKGKEISPRLLRTAYQIIDYINLNYRDFEKVVKETDTVALVKPWLSDRGFLWYFLSNGNLLRILPLGGNLLALFYKKAMV